MDPTEERESRENPPEGVRHSSEYHVHRDKGERERHVECRSDSQEPVDEGAFDVGGRRSFVDRPPIRRGPEHSSEYEKEAHRDWPGFDELVKIPAPLGQVLDTSLLVEVVADDAQAGQRPEAGQSGQVLRHASNLPRFIFLKSVFFRFPSSPRAYIFLTSTTVHYYRKRISSALSKYG